MLLVVSSMRSSTASAAAVKQVPDQSLSGEGYLALGVPAYDRDWTSAQMSAAVSKLQALASTSPEKLPRFQSPKSGALFARIVSREPLHFYRDKSHPLDARMQEALGCLQATNSLLKAYLPAFNLGRVSGDDLIELFGALLRSTQANLELVDEFVPTVSKQDPKYPARMAGLDRMRRGLASIVGGAITSLTERQSYVVETRVKLLGFCRETFPAIVPKLTAPSQAEIVERLSALAADPQMRDLPDLSLLRDEVKAALVAKTNPSDK
jgi:hypothetical protein